MKTKAGKLSEHQKHFIDTCNERGVKAFVARSIQDVVDNLKGILIEDVEEDVEEDSKEESKEDSKKE